MQNKLIIYDGNCQVCVGLRDLMLRLRLVGEQECVAYQQLQPPLRQQVQAERFRNEMALIDTHGGDTLYGAEGVSFVFASKLKLLQPLFRFRPFFLLFRFLYKIIAFNRYLIATPKKQTISCDCYPEAATKFRLVYIGFALLLSVCLTAFFGVSVHQALGVGPGAGAGQLLLMAGTGWVIQIVLAALFLERQQALDYVGHLGTIMVVGLLVLVPAICFYFITGLLFYPLPVLSVLCSSGLMLYLHYHRVQHLGLSQRWTVQWFLLLQATAVLWLLYFQL
ncbi:DCC1-like thiol-disulfide oxidoreductase family protein [Pontibacter beigongshangensis]|uniref:DCC1-like thiol-disulfide oxidoreductase family protein n=1 Tax=Pontibacter beigongshangensis TaxID=2574733 RepID=UPI00164FE003|nr:DCC1-like thiol-disulfide oxidoreductase family protein [Pontibacter beigongshangensis]